MLSDNGGLLSLMLWMVGWLMLAVLSLLLVLNLTGCASKSPSSSEMQRLPKLDGVLDLPSWQSDKASCSTELKSLLHSAPES